MNSKRRMRAAIPIAAILLLSSSTLVVAGYQGTWPLSVNAENRYANGSLGGVVNSPDNVQYAECGSNATTGYCTLRDAEGTYYSCYTTNTALIAVIRSMPSDAYFSVAWNANNQCTYVLSYASSRMPPKRHP